MIGKLTQDGVDIAILEDNGDWSSPPDGDEVTEAMAELLNVAHHPVKNSQTGDHHLPFGVMALNRAAGALGEGVQVELAQEIEPLPEGAIS